MSERTKNVMNIVRPTAEVVAAGVAAGIFGVAGITLRNHRELTHRSIKLHPWLQKVFDFEQRTIGIDGPIPWADTHRTHHHDSDLTRKTFLDIYRGVMAMEEGAFDGVGIVVPNTIRGLDPAVEEFTLAEVMQIGKEADEYIRKRLGNRFNEPTYSAERLKELFSGKPAYFYPKPHKRGKPYTQDEIERILLTDPHGPPLVGPRENGIEEVNGVKTVALENINMYSQSADLLRANPWLISEDLRPADGDLGKARWYHKTAGFAIPAALMFVRNGEYNPRGLGKAIIQGAAINAIRVGMEIFGGNVTNSLGHAGAGMLTERKLVEAIRNGTLKIEVNDDGSFTTNADGAGLFGKFIKYATLDEVSGQKNHHDAPWDPAYTKESGWRGFVEAPWGKTIGYLAKAKWFPLIEEGEGFGVPNNERPDMPSTALALIQQIRAAQKAGRRKLRA
jgi:hypothetical protein